MLASFGGKIILLYASLAGIPCSNTQDIMAHEKFRSADYQKIRTFYNVLASKSKDILKRKEKHLQLRDFMV